MDAINSDTPIIEIVQILAQAGCPDITDQLDITRCSQSGVADEGHGNIYKGLLTDGSHVAIKAMRGDKSLNISKDDVVLKQTARELLDWFRLNHPNVTQFLGIAVFRERIGLISPWIDPGNFYSFIRNYPGVDRISLCMRIADGLRYLHDQNVVHGDLKVQNVLIDADGMPKLVDFGLRTIGQPRLFFSSTRSQRDGAARWMAPELIKGGPRSYEADIYALSMTSIEIFSENIPFPELADDWQVMFAVASTGTMPDQPERLKIRSPRYVHLWSLMQRSWDQEPRARPKAGEWSALDDVLIGRRCHLLATSLPYVLSHGYSEQGPLTNLDTEELLPLTSDEVKFCIPRLEDQEERNQQVQSSFEMIVRFYTGAMGDKKRAREKRAEILENLINLGLEKRIRQVRQWLNENLTHLPRDHHTVCNLYDQLNTLIGELWDAARICSMTCSRCELRCVHSNIQPHIIHDCGTSHICTSECAVRDAHSTPLPCKSLAGHAGMHLCDKKAHVCPVPCFFERIGYPSHPCLQVLGHADEHKCADHVSRCTHNCAFPPVEAIPRSTSPKPLFECSQYCFKVGGSHSVHSCEDCENKMIRKLENNEPRTTYDAQKAELEAMKEEHELWKHEAAAEAELMRQSLLKEMEILKEQLHRNRFG